MIVERKVPIEELYFEAIREVGACRLMADFDHVDYKEDPPLRRKARVLRFLRERREEFSRASLQQVADARRHLSVRFVRRRAVPGAVLGREKPSIYRRVRSLAGPLAVAARDEAGFARSTTP